jgi:Ca2+-transporting ATPase
LLSANIAEVLSIFIISVFLRQPFLAPIMILLVNLITDSLPALALGIEKSERDVMDNPPEISRRSLFAGRFGMRIILQGVLQTGLVMLSYVIAKYALNSVEEKLPLAMLFVTLIIVQLFHAYNCKKDRHSIFSSNPFSNLLLNLSFVIGALLVVAIIYVPILREFFKLPQLNLNEMIIAVAIAALIVPIVEIYKIIENQIEKTRQKK